MMFGMEFWNSGGGLITIVFIATLWLTAVATYSYRKKMQRKGLEPEPKANGPGMTDWLRGVFDKNYSPVPRKTDEVANRSQSPIEGMVGGSDAIDDIVDVEVVIKDQEEKVAALPKAARKAVVAKIAHDVKRGQEEGGRVREGNTKEPRRHARPLRSPKEKMESGGPAPVQEDNP